MKKKYIFYCLCFVTVIVLIGCSKNTSKIKYNNDIFTKDIYNDIIEINYMENDTTHKITDSKMISNVYKELASLELSPSNDKIQKYGQMYLKIITSKQTIDIGLQSEEISIGKDKYYVDKDICTTLQNLLLK